MNDRTQLTNILKKILQGGVIVVLFVPLLYADSTFFPFVFGKVVVFRSLVEVLLPVWVTLMALSREDRPRWGMLTALLGSYVVALLVATIFGMDPARSFWSNHERMLGTFTYIHVFLYALMIVSAFARANVKKFLAWALAVSVFEVGAYLIQVLNPGFLAGGPGFRQWGTLGNYLYLSEFLFVHLLIAMYLAMKSEHKNWRMVSWIWAGVLAIVLILNTSRSTFIGATAGVLLASLMIAFWGSRVRTRIIGWGVVGLVGVLASLIIIFSTSSFMRGNPVLSRLAYISSTSGTAQTRFIAWRIALQAFAERPILGWGPENYYHAFNLHYNPVSLEHSYYETWFDRPHNIFLEILSTSGVIGLVTYLAFPLAAAWVFIRRLRAQRDTLGESVILTTLLLVPLVIKALVFDNAASLIDGALIAAWVMLVLAPGEKEAVPGGKSTTTALAWGGVAAIVAIVLLYYAHIASWIANSRGLYAARVTRADPAAGLALYDQALAVKNPYAGDLRVAIGRDYLEAASTGRLSKDLIISGGTQASAALTEHLAGRAQDVYSFLILGQIYTLMGTVDPTYLANAEEVFAKGIQYSPKRQQYLYSWGRLRMLRKDFAGAEELFARARDYDLNISDSYWLLALVAGEQGRNAEALSLMKKAITLNYEFKSRNEALFAIQYFTRAGDERAVRMAVARAVGVFADQGLIRFLSAQLKARDGDREGAEAEASLAAQLDPSLRADVGSFLNQLAASSTR